MIPVTLVLVTMVLVIFALLTFVSIVFKLLWLHQLLSSHYNDIRINEKILKIALVSEDDFSSYLISNNDEKLKNTFYFNYLFVRNVFSTFL